MHKLTDDIQESRPKAAETVSGEVQRVVFHAEDTGYSIFTLAFDTGRSAGTITVLGNLPGLKEGMFISADGKHVHDQKRGRQFKAELIRVTPPTSAEGIRKYLCSGMVKGIGPVLAGRIVEIFGDKTLEVLDTDSGRLREVDGLGEAKIDSIRAAWKEHTSIRDVMVFLQQYGISTSKAAKILKKYGDDAIRTISEDPYILCKDIEGIGFTTADRIAIAMSVPPASNKRIAAGVVHALEESKMEGHCALPTDILAERAVKMLEIGVEQVNAMIVQLQMDGQIVRNTVCGRDLVYLPYMRSYERSIAGILRKMLGTGEAKFSKGASEESVNAAEKALGKTLAVNQRQAVVMCLKSRVSIITGGPGSGKSTILGAARQILVEQKAKVVLCAPTGRAAKRMSETTGLPAKTIHRLLAYSPFTGDFQHDAKNPLEGDVFIVDECSMVDLPLAFKLLRAIPKDGQVIFVGDVDQLPSVGPGSFLSDMIHSHAVPTTFLREIFRQAANSRIIRNAHLINQGMMPEDGLAGEDYFFFSRHDAESIKACMAEVVLTKIPAKLGLDPKRDVQVLAPMHKGPLGIKELNIYFQGLLNPDRGPSHASNGYMFHAGDKVLQTKNDYDLGVYNGDMGMILWIDTKDKIARIDFDGDEVSYPFSAFNHLTLGWVVSIHKSQGAEYPAVVMPMVKAFYHMLQKNLIYTGVTRGKKLVVMVGEKAALNMAVRNNKANERFSGLQHRLTDAVSDWVEAELFAA